MKHVVIFEPIGSGAALVFAAKRLGYYTSVIGFNQKDRKLSQPVLDACDNLVECDTNNEAEVFNEISQLNKTREMDAIISGNEYYIPLVAVLARELNLPGQNPGGVQALRNKHSMRDALAAKKVRVPHYQTVSSVDDIQAMVKQLVFPVVLKPLEAAGSFHVSYVTNEEELIRSYERAQQDAHRELDHELGQSMLVESYLVGPEYSVEGFMAQDGPAFLSITEKILGPKPGFVECGHIVPANISQDLKIKIQQYIQEVTTALGIEMGVFHAEVRFSLENEPVLVEIGARLPGDRIVELIELAGGPSMAELSVRAHLGEALSSQFAPLEQYAGVVFFLPTSDFSQQHSEHQFTDVQRLSGYVADSLTINKMPSSPTTNDYRSRLGNAIFVSENYDTLRNVIDHCC